MNIFKRAILIFLLVLAAISVKAEVNIADSVSNASVSLLICSPGSEIYELEGHAALRINHPTYGDFIVNWGLFDFNAPNFVYRFTKGETDYQAGAYPTDIFVKQYQNEGRGIIEIPVKLTPKQVEHVVAVVTENLKPENRVYHYNYVYDNCSTRPLAIIQHATEDSLITTIPETFSDDPTFRKLMTYFHRNYPWYQFGIDLALGSGIDKKITSYEATFAPTMVAELIRNDNRFGKPTILLNEADGGPEGPTPWYLTPIFVCWLFLAIAIIVTVLENRHTKLGRWFDLFYYLLVALAGIVLTFLIFVSIHEATSPNWLYLWLNPLALIVVIGTGINRLTPLVLLYQIVNFASLIALCIIAALGVQSLNTAFYPLIIIDLLRSADYIYKNKICLLRKNC
ncbi:MAG: DUF4105 domain-containing protein [Muribaculaceae bacterium]|nr:DUF4105 domain-containing protein [Muribaculaceae bacterium]